MQLDGLQRNNTHGVFVNAIFKMLGFCRLMELGAWHARMKAVPCDVQSEGFVALCHVMVLRGQNPFVEDYDICQYTCTGYQHLNQHYRSVCLNTVVMREQLEEDID